MGRFYVYFDNLAAIAGWGPRCSACFVDYVQQEMRAAARLPGEMRRATSTAAYMQIFGITRV